MTKPGTETNGSPLRLSRGRRLARREGVASARNLDGVFDALLVLEHAGGDGVLQLGRQGELPVSSLDKLYFRAAQRTKGDVMRYYVRAAPWLLPLMADRPLALRRHPDGVRGESFFQQAPPDNTPPGVRVEEVPTEDGPARRLIGGNLATLLYCVQLGAIAVNPWHSRVGSLDHPDYSILDLDPGPRTRFATVVQVARWLRELLAAAGVSAAVKTSGSRGLHILMPLPPGAGYESSQLVAQLFARRVVEAHRHEATTVRSRGQRSQRAVYVDYLQNAMGKSLVAAFSLRVREGATVSTPLAWEELTEDLDPEAFTIDTVPDELAERGRMLHDVLRRGNRLERLLASA
jgi:bifunctional non-homologous end joining protein LigD